MKYTGIRILVTGGLGFIGSSVAVRLVREGARVTVVDNSIQGCGANRHNLADVAGDVEVLDADISEIGRWPEILRRTQIVFNLAGEISHTRSMEDPMRDLVLNTVSQLQFLLSLKDHAPGVRVVFAGTRQVYGKPQYLPLDERHPLEPVDFNGIHKLAANHYHRLLSQTGAIDAVTLRLTNVYGPRIALNQPAQGVLGHFFKRALVGEDIAVFGDGKQLRDPLFVDDAVEAFLRAGLAPRLEQRTFNLGGSEALSIGVIAKHLATIGCCRLMLREFPEEHKAIDIGSYYTDSGRFREVFGWAPHTPFVEGVRKTLEYFRERPEQYLSAAETAKVRSRANVAV